MERKRPREVSKARWRGNWITLALVGIAVIGTAAWWLATGADERAGGRPHLVVDRTDVDLGTFAFDVPARAVFTVSNKGDGMLRVVDLPPVRAVLGC